MKNIKVVKRVGSFLVTLSVLIATIASYSSAGTYDTFVEYMQAHLGESGGTDYTTAGEALVLGSSTATFLPTALFSSTLPKFVDHPNWVEITKDESTEIYNENKPFIVVYYRTSCGISQSKRIWFRDWMDTYDIPIYGVEIDVYGIPSWAYKKLPGGGSEDIALPVMTFVINNQDVVSHTGTGPEDTVYARAAAVAQAMLPGTEPQIPWDGETDLSGGTAITIDHDITIDGDVSVGRGCTVDIPAGVVLTVNGSLTVEGSLKGAGEVIVTSNGTITGSGDFSMAEYVIDVIGGVASQTKAKAGTAIYLTADAKAGQQLEKWQVNRGDIIILGNRFVMPVKTVALQAVFQASPYLLTIGTGEGGTTDISSSNIPAGQTVTITALPDAQYEFQKWSLSGITVADSTHNPLIFTMPPTPVALTPIFEPIPTATPDDPTLPTVKPSTPTLPTGPSFSNTSNSSSGGSSNSDGVRTTSDENNAQLKSISKEEAITAYDAALKLSQKTGSDIVNLRFAGRYSEIRLDVMKALAAKAKEDGVNIRLIIDQIFESVVVTRIELNPANATCSISLSAFCDSLSAGSNSNHLSKWFSNDITVVSTGQTGEYNMAVKLAIKVNINYADIKDLHFYTYDKQTNLYKSIKEPAAWLDEKGYLHFTTNQAGDIVISNGQLKKN